MSENLLKDRQGFQQNEPGENKRILIVDDQASIHEDFKKILRAERQESTELDEMEASLFECEQGETFQPDFEVTSAYQGSEAVLQVELAVKDKKPFALAFVDVRMPPGMDGIETISSMWQRDPNMQMVICTAFSDYSWDETIQTLGQSDQLLILKKPFDVIEVMQLACALVAKWNLTRQAKMSQQQLETMVAQRTLQLTQQAEKLRTTLSELKETKIHLFQADKLASIGQLAAGLAHEINNPIGYVSCNLNTLNQYVKEIKPIINLQIPELKDTAVDIEFILEDIDDLMKDSIEGIDRVAGIVSDLTEFSHVNSPEQLPVDLNQLIDKTLTVVNSQIKHKVTVEKQYSELPYVVVNGGQIGQVIMNLLVNASQAINDKGCIYIRTKLQESFVIVEIEDNGSGIPEAQQHKIFDPFFTTKPVGEGTGLGLHMVHTIISQHQGKIDLSSQIGKGTCFTITLPINGASDVESPQEACL